MLEIKKISYIIYISANVSILLQKEMDIYYW